MKKKKKEKEVNKETVRNQLASLFIVLLFFFLLPFFSFSLFLPLYDPSFFFTLSPFFSLSLVYPFAFFPSSCFLTHFFLSATFPSFFHTYLSSNSLVRHFLPSFFSFFLPSFSLVLSVSSLSFFSLPFLPSLFEPVPFGASNSQKTSLYYPT